MRVHRLPLVLLGLGTTLLAQLARPLEPPRRHPPPAPVMIDPATAEAWELTLLPGIGPVRARRVVALREDPAAGDAWRAMMRRWQRHPRTTQETPTPASPTGRPSRR